MYICIYYIFIFIHIIHRERETDKKRETEIQKKSLKKITPKMIIVVISGLWDFR